MNSDEDSFEQEEQYVLSQDDDTIVAATQALLWKTARSTLVNPRQLEAIARVLQVFEALPAIAGDIQIEVQVTGPRRVYGTHEIYHWWNIEIGDGDLVVTSQGHFYRPETGGDTFTSMVWRASPGFASEYRDLLTSIAIVDDAQPFDGEVEAINFSEGGYSLEVTKDGEDVGGDDEDDDEGNNLGEVEMSGSMSLKEVVESLEAFGVECVWASRELTHLHSIDLNEASLPDAAYQLMEQIPYLTTLEARTSSISDRTLRFIRHLNSLEWLCLRRTAVTDAGLQYLQGLSGLKHLDLIGSQVSGPGLLYLRGLVSLEELHVSGFQHHDKYLEILRRDLPQCGIYLN